MSLVHQLFFASEKTPDVVDKHPDIIKAIRRLGEGKGDIVVVDLGRGDLWEKTAKLSFQE